VLIAKFADTDGDGKVDPEEARRAERILEQHQTRMMLLVQLMREKVRQITGMGGLHDIRRLFKKFDPDLSGQISWEEFDHALSSLGIQMEQAELTYLMRLFDHDGDGTVDYAEFCQWVDSSTKLDQTAVAEKIFAGIDGGFTPPEKGPKGPSENYMRAWLKAHPDEVYAAQEEKDYKAQLEAEKVKATKKMMYSSALHSGINNEWETTTKINRSLASGSASYGLEKKVKEAAKARSVLADNIVGMLRDSISKKMGVSDPTDQLEALWNQFDANGDGIISWKEFCTGMKQLGIKQTDRELMQVISEFDTNGDGGLDYYEFMAKIAPVPADAIGSTKDTYKTTVAWKKRQLRIQALRKAPIEPKPAAQGLLKGGHSWVKLP